MFNPMEREGNLFMSMEYEGVRHTDQLTANKS